MLPQEIVAQNESHMNYFGPFSLQVFTLDITQQLKAYEVEYHVLQEEMAYNGAQQDAGQVIQKLESSNTALKQQNLQLLEQLQVANAHNQSLEVQLQNMTSREIKLKSHVHTLELERTALLNAVAKLRKLLTDEVIDTEDASFPLIVTDSTTPGSPAAVYPAVDRILQEEGSLYPSPGTANSSNSSLNSSNGQVTVGSSNSLNEWDNEVATITRSCNGSLVLETAGVHGDNRPSSAVL